MHLSKFTDYALRTCLYLGVNQDRLVPISEVSSAHAISRNNLMKIVNQLVNGQVIESGRGRYGGIKLTNPPNETSVGQIVRLMEGDERLVDCSDCILAGGCGLDGALAKAKGDFYKALDKVRVADTILSNAKTLPLLQAATADSR